MPLAFNVDFKFIEMKRFTLLIIAYFSLLFSCSKLEVKPDLSLVVPSTLEDFQGLMDNTLTIFSLAHNMYGEIAANDFYVNHEDYQSNFTPLTSEIYKWNILELDDPFISDWDYQYGKISYSNIVLDGLAIYSSTLETGFDYNNIKGQALFHRAYSYYMLAEEFAPVYDVANVNLPAIPLRTSSDINLSYPLSSVSEVYSLIVEDLKEAAELLPEQSLYKTRPNKVAAYGLLARVYLAMDDYANALQYASASLAIYGTLLDFNLIDPDALYPIPQFNDEVIFHARLGYDHLLTRNVLKVYPEIIGLYDDIDLRKQILFFEIEDGSYGFKGSYDGFNIYEPFGGIATDEILLIRAECHARLNNINPSLDDLNTLLANRYRAGQFVPVNSSNQEELLARVLLERRKELLYRGLRWTDLRRLNKDPKFAMTLQRELNGEVFTLPPNDPRYVFPIPSYVTTIQR